MTASTTSLAAGSWRNANTVPMFKGPALHVHAFDSTAIATTQIDEQDDITEVGYLPAGVTVYGLIINATDLDTAGSPALVYKAILGSTDVVTGITVGQSASTSAFYLGTPYTTTDYTVLSLKVTTAAGTAASGTIKVRALYTAP
jgi:hypothetical protein